MILAINAGNSQTVIGCMEGTEIRALCRASSDPGRTAHEYAALLRQLLELEGVGPASFEGAILASVVPALTQTLREAVALLTGHRALVVGAGLKTGLNIQIDDPAQLGADLAVAAVAALERYTPPLLIADMGTATTFTVLDGASRLRGGAIVPGVALSLSALSDGAAALPAVSLEAPKSCIGSNTVDCMKAGAVFGAAATVDGYAARVEEALGTAVTVVATGPIAPVIAPHCRREIICDGDLALRGLALLYRKNKR